MVRRLSILAIALLVMGATVAGCGSDNSSSDNGSDNSSKSSDSGGSSGGSGGTANPQAVASCKKSVNAAPNLKADIKSDLAKICEKAGKGDEAAVRKATKEVCVKIVEQSAPAGPARDQAKKACDAAQTGKVPSY